MIDNRMWQKRAAFKRKLAVKWVKEYRRDVHDKIEELADKNYPVKRSRAKNTDFSAEIKELGK